MSEIKQDMIPVRMLTQYAYCKRLAYMEFVQGEFEYNAEVVEGKYAHRNVDKISGTRKMGTRESDEVIHARSVMLSDNNLGLIAKIDLIEISGDEVMPVEYKRGSTPKNDSRSYQDHIVQVCAQGLLLRANGYKCTKGMVYYVSSKQKIEISLDEETVEMTLQMLREMRETIKTDTIPPPLVDSPKCPRCSMVGICLPDETNLLADTVRLDKEQVRRMYPMRSDANPVYVQEQGASITKSGDCIYVKIKDGESRKIKMIDISEITVFGNVQITTQAIRELCNRNVPICYMTYGGWFTAMTEGMSNKNVELRIHQHRRSADRDASLLIARQMVFGKIKNCITILRRNHQNVPQNKIAEIKELAERALTVKRYDTLLGIEGMAARLYFSEFAGMIKAQSLDFDFKGRNKRPPKDPVNAILSFLYSMLARQSMATVSRIGFDPYLGFLHRPKYGKPALALDLIEEFRPIVADSVCITIINNGEITRDDLTMTDFGVNLTRDGRRTVISAYDRRMNSAIQHPLLGYAASYHRIMETQARLLSRHVLGEIPAYPVFQTR